MPQRGDQGGNHQLGLRILQVVEYIHLGQPVADPHIQAVPGKDSGLFRIIDARELRLRNPRHRQYPPASGGGRRNYGAQQQKRKESFYHLLHQHPLKPDRILP